jgi:hypothetical protein
MVHLPLFVPCSIHGIKLNCVLIADNVRELLRGKCKGAWLALFIPWLVVVPTPALYFHKKD